MIEERRAQQEAEAEALRETLLRAKKEKANLSRLARRLPPPSAKRRPGSPPAPAADVQLPILDPAPDGRVPPRQRASHVIYKGAYNETERLRIASARHVEVYQDGGDSSDGDASVSSYSSSLHTPNDGEHTSPGRGIYATSGTLALPSNTHLSSRSTGHIAPSQQIPPCLEKPPMFPPQYTSLAPTGQAPTVVKPIFDYTAPPPCFHPEVDFSDEEPPVLFTKADLASTMTASSEKNGNKRPASSGATRLLVASGSRPSTGQRSSRVLASQPAPAPDIVSKLERVEETERQPPIRRKTPPQWQSNLKKVPAPRNEKRVSSASTAAAPEVVEPPPPPPIEQLAPATSPVVERSPTPSAQLIKQELVRQSEQLLRPSHFRTAPAQPLRSAARPLGRLDSTLSQLSDFMEAEVAAPPRPYTAVADKSVGRQRLLQTAGRPARPATVANGRPSKKSPAPVDEECRLLASLETLEGRLQSNFQRLGLDKRPQQGR
ncbi:hypothetical protein RI367_007143 [Sorochytrium milnesiophthora]